MIIDSTLLFSDDQAGLLQLFKAGADQAWS